MDEPLIVVPGEPLPPDPTAPLCPYCLQDPAQVSSRGPLLLGNLHVMVIYCGNLECRKVWTVEVVGTAQPKIVDPAVFRRPS